MSGLLYDGRHLEGGIEGTIVVERNGYKDTLVYIHIGWAMGAVSVYDHLRLTDTDYRDGIYRVVGRTEDTVTMLRVGTKTGRRVNTGKLVTVPTTELDQFEPASNPDGNRPLREQIPLTVAWGYWSIRVFGQQVANHPVPTTVALALIAFGLWGDFVVDLPELSRDLVTIIGILALTYIGSGRL